MLRICKMASCCDARRDARMDGEARRERENRLEAYASRDRGEEV